MAHCACDILLTDEPLAAPNESDGAETGAIVDFWGVVRETEGDAQISGIDYEAHRTMAEHQLRKIADDATGQFTLMQIIVHHRVGFVAVGEASLFVRVGSKHRAEGFRACQWIVDELKQRAPIWKHPKVGARAAAAV